MLEVHEKEPATSFLILHKHSLLYLRLYSFSYRKSSYCLSMRPTGRFLGVWPHLVWRAEENLGGGHLLPKVIKWQVSTNTGPHWWAWECRQWDARGAGGGHISRDLARAPPPPDTGCPRTRIPATARFYPGRWSQTVTRYNRKFENGFTCKKVLEYVSPSSHDQAARKTVQECSPFSALLRGLWWASTGPAALSLPLGVLPGRRWRPFPTGCHPGRLPSPQQVCGTGWRASPLPALTFHNHTLPWSYTA